MIEIFLLIVQENQSTINEFALKKTRHFIRISESFQNTHTNFLNVLQVIGLLRNYTIELSGDSIFKDGSFTKK